VVLAGFQHRPGVHRGSTARADALRARGLDLSEPMAFFRLLHARFLEAERPFHEEVAALVP